MAEQRTRMSRAARTARGLVGAVATTLFAAASHALAGGEITATSVVATAVLAMPLCVALAGRLGSLWRLALAVSASQFVYHWVFAGLGMSRSMGAASADTADAAWLGPHAAHLGTALLGDSPVALGTGAGTLGAETLMWASHAVAAAVTIALLHRGERAWMELTRLLLHTVLPALALGARTVSVPAPGLRPRRVASSILTLQRLCSLAAISHRGPPARA